MSATVIITPASAEVKDNFVINAVTGTPNPAGRQVQARILTATSAETTTAAATGVEQIPGKRATGVLTFINASANVFTIPSSVLTGASGVQVTFTGPVTVPAHAPTTTVAGYAVNVGISGNIPALDNNGPCCVPNDQIFVKNMTAFSGEQDPQTSTFVQQSDIDAAASTAKPLATQTAQAALQQQRLANEAPVNSPQCTLQVTSNHTAGDRAPTVTVSAQATCTQEVYDQQAAQSMAAELLNREASRNPGPNYALVGNLVTSVTQATVVDTRGTISLLIAAEGIWAYQLSPAQMKEFAQVIAGKSQSEAISILSQQPGVSQAQIDIPGGGNILPQDPAQIAITIQSVSGLS